MGAAILPGVLVGRVAGGRAGRAVRRGSGAIGARIARPTAGCRVESRATGQRVERGRCDTYDIGEVWSVLWSVLPFSTRKLTTFQWFLKKRPRRESNPDLRFRKPPFYPLNYGDRARSATRVYLPRPGHESKTARDDMF